MASSPPLQMEDQTDEDFFDKLVNDDFDTTKSGHKTLEGDDRDESKPFPNLSISDVGADFDDSGGESDFIGKVEPRSGINDVIGPNVHLSDGNSLVSSNSLGDESLFKSNNGVWESEVTSDSTASKCSGSGGLGVKEVQWSAFHADSCQNGISSHGSYDDFFNELGDGTLCSSGELQKKLTSGANITTGSEELISKGLGDRNAVNEEYRDIQAYEVTPEYNVEEQDQNSGQYWENLYPGWKYDPGTGQWYQISSYDATLSNQGNAGHNSAGGNVVSDGKSNLSYLQQTIHSVAGTVTESGTTTSVTSWNQVPAVNNGYPEHMIFDAQYPGWYYDTIAQEWRTLDSYIALDQATNEGYGIQNQNGPASSAVISNENASDIHHNYNNYEPQGSGGPGQDNYWDRSLSNCNQHNQNGFSSTVAFSQNNGSGAYGASGGNQKYGTQGFADTVCSSNWDGSLGNNDQRGFNMWQPEIAARSQAFSECTERQQLNNVHSSKIITTNHVDHKFFNSTGSVPLDDKANHIYSDANAIGFQNFVPAGNLGQPYDQTNAEHDKQQNLPNHYYNKESLNFSQQPFQSNGQFAFAQTTGNGKSSAGRPPHALVTFGFAGKLVVMKNHHSFSSPPYGNEDLGGSVNILNLMEVVAEKSDASNVGVGSCDYFRSLCQQSFPGPLVGGTVGCKELNKWIDERIAHCHSSSTDYEKGEVLGLLLSLLKIACQHYGKFRSPFGTDTSLRESDVPEAAVAKLFSSAKKNSGYSAPNPCLQNFPSGGQLRATAFEVQNLLVSGRKNEALLCAQEGQLWGPALVIASQLGDQFYVDTARKMAFHQLVPGSPLRTLCLLIAGQPADVFSTDSGIDGSIPGAFNTFQQPSQFGANMLDDWEENLAVITANRTKDDELVLIHLGDCLWKERSEIIAAHICYLVADANLESYSDSARVCLLGADHWKFPRTYASPAAIQRTELYEYSKVLGNSQFILSPFQPYKLVYAYMLAEVGKVSDSLKYCQAVLKSLKTGRTPEVETWKQLVSSLEERLRTHQQGGYATNLAPAKLVGKLLNFFDSTAHRVVGGLPPPAPSTLQGTSQSNGHYHQPAGPRVLTSQSTMAMSSLMASASMEPISEWTVDGNRKPKHNRSASEPDFGRTPRQVGSSSEASSSNPQDKASVSSGPSRFSRFGFGSQFLQRTVGLVLKSRTDRQAKLGESNKFYYDEKLKRWVEEGAEQPAEEQPLAPPPTTAAFQNDLPDHKLKTGLKNEGSPSREGPEFCSPAFSDHSTGIPPIPPGSNQFSARGRTGVRSRYVDTFNKGGGSPVNLFQSPQVKPAAPTGTKFFVPSPTPSGEQKPDTPSENTPTAEDATPASAPPLSSAGIQRVPSMNNVYYGTPAEENDAAAPPSRRTSSWGGSFNSAYSPPATGEAKPLGEVLGIPTSEDPVGGGGGLADLHEVEL